MTNIAEKFKTTSAKIIKKWKNLVQSYRVYRRRAKQKFSGSGANDVYILVWFAYNAIHCFMDDVYTPQRSIDTLTGVEESDSNEKNDDNLDDESEPTEYLEMQNSSETAIPTGSNFVRKSPSKKDQTLKKTTLKKVFKLPKKLTRKYCQQRDKMRKKVLMN